MAEIVETSCFYFLLSLIIQTNKHKHIKFGRNNHYKIFNFSKYYSDYDNSFAIEE